MFTRNIIFVLLAIFNQQSYALSDLQPTHLSVYEFEQISSGRALTQKDIDKLYEDFESHFGIYIGPNAVKTNFRFIVGSETSFKTFQLMTKLEHAMAQGFNVKHFAKFGFSFRNQYSFDIHYDTHPHLVSFLILFNFVTIARDGKEHFLLPRGFRPEDIDIIDNYVAENDFNTNFQNEYYGYLEHNLSIIRNTLNNRQSLGEVEVARQLRAFNDNKRFIKYRTQRNWAIGLMSTLDKQRQRILKKVLVELLNGTSTKSSDSEKSSQTKLINYLLSDHVDKQLEIFKSHQNYRNNTRLREQYQ